IPQITWLHFYFICSRNFVILILTLFKLSWIVIISVTMISEPLEPKDFRNFKDLEQFNGEILKNYITALDGFDLLHSRFNNELIWLDLLKNYSVRRTLTSIFARLFQMRLS
ncbi:hypothetical protein SSS_02804, partial [Sarcoptes scabiei]